VSIDVDFFAYHRSIGQEFKAIKDRFRNLIGHSHWLSEGEYKESVLRYAIRSRLPEIFHVGRGFVCYPGQPSTQIDILITRKDKPTLFKDGDLVIVTPDCVEAIIEVKTRQDSASQLIATLAKLADQTNGVRQWDNDGQCWSGLFVFEGPDPRSTELCDQRSADMLTAQYQACNGEDDRAIDCVALGPHLFSRYWSNSLKQADGPVDGPAWHSYIFNRRSHKGLAPAYFISNLIWQISPDIAPEMRYAYFPDPERSGKEFYRKHYIAQINGQINHF
jgi:hypothetical protein